MLPEKLPRNKALVELEPRPGGATDLAGDAGEHNAVTSHFLSEAATLPYASSPGMSRFAAILAEHATLHCDMLTHMPGSCIS